MTQAIIPDIGLGQTIIRRCELTPRRPAISFQDYTYTYAEFGERILRLAATLRDGGVCRGDRVGFLGFNHPVFLETLYAANVLGAVFVPLNFRLTGPELEYIVNDAGVHTLLADSSLQPVIDRVREALVCKRYIDSEMSGGKAAAKWEDLDQLRKAATPLERSERVEQNDIALIMYTSGTTGRPKGAMLTHGNLFWNNANSTFVADMTGEVSLTCAPLFHIGGLNVTTLATLSKGAHLVLHREFDPGLVLSDIEKYKVEVMFGAPAMFLFMSQHPGFADTNLDSITMFICGGAPVPLPLINLYESRGIAFCQGYGLTETAPFGSMLTPDFAAAKTGSAGLPPIFNGLKIVDADRNTLATGEKGEVCLRGPNIMKGYWNKPEATAAAIDTEGWFYTGDVGHLDEDGFLFISDRVKDMVISGGENVYPAEVESVLLDHPAIAELAVIGLPDDKWGEAVTAIVVLTQGSELTLEELRDFGDERLAKYKLPLHLHTIDVLPRNPAGKILKFKLREQFS